jgi:hypothetical protein
VVTPLRSNVYRGMNTNIFKLSSAESQKPRKLTYFEKFIFDLDEVLRLMRMGIENKYLDNLIKFLNPDVIFPFSDQELRILEGYEKYQYNIYNARIRKENERRSRK